MQLEDIKILLSPEEIVLPESPEYDDQSRTWAAQWNKKPRLVVKPKDVGTLSTLMQHLDKSDLDISVRCTGIGNASAKDVLVSLSAFKSFSFSREDETITFGAGHDWGEIDRKVEEQAPGYAAVGARCTYVGVGGSILHGGQSWLSSEYGLASDPQNLLDAQVVRMDGSIIWASEEPDLLWALRGGGGGFAVVTAFKMRVYKYPSSIYCGQIVYPAEALQDVARQIAAFCSRCSDSRLALHLYCLNLSMGAYAGNEPKAGLVIFVYDARGEEHGRSEDGFKWALDIKGAMDMTTSMNLRGVNQQFDSLKAIMGVTNTWQCGATLFAIDEDLILRTWKWYVDLLQKDPGLARSTYVLVEVMQKAAYQSLGYPSKETAWPHTRNQHNLQLGAGRVPGSREGDALGRQAMVEGPYEIDPRHTKADYFPNFLDDYVDAKEVFGENWTKVVEIKKRYDPHNKLGGVFAKQ
ncbi:hypothetical protein LTR47_007391 [Exophiala xenobiotica]|nr:hypothetical protein LTR47_007391 [Exophiala xenobiotica]KAK5248973.1 hypothetical protein LTS06_006039 [Exophiala xenobiotica]KAK5364456.1 hypothetical protein LTS03_009233 [Exophiala xenobiotica]KAK5405069.1 hypothetical protein LTR06_009336 [Exophiala xenobiotica]